VDRFKGCTAGKGPSAKRCYAIRYVDVFDEQALVEARIADCYETVGKSDAGEQRASRKGFIRECSNRLSLNFFRNYEWSAGLIITADDDNFWARGIDGQIAKICC
jgi:hypothetical protein